MEISQRASTADTAGARCEEVVVPFESALGARVVRVIGYVLPELVDVALVPGERTLRGVAIANASVRVVYIAGVMTKGPRGLRVEGAVASEREYHPAPCSGERSLAGVS